MAQQHQQNRQNPQQSSFGQPPSLPEKTQQAAAGLAEKAKDTASNIAERGQQAFDAAREQVSHLGDKANETTSNVGGGMKSAADTLRHSVSHEGMIGSATESVAHTLEAGGTYLQEHDLKAMGEDVTDLIRAYPWAAVGVCLGLGFLIGRAVGGRSS